MSAGGEPTVDGAIETLRLVHADLVRERDRLRDARRAVTAQLGPFPASAGLVVGLFAALQPHFHGHPTRIVLISAAVLIFALIVSVSFRGLRFKPYRELSKITGEGLPEREWLTAENERLRGLLDGDLAKNFSRERNALLTVQVLLVLEATLLVLSRLVG